MPSYQTARLEEYNPRFLKVAQDLFDRVRRDVPENRTKKHRGSFSFFGQRVSDTAAKIVIFESRLGKPSRDWPEMRDGVYVWIRANGSLGDGIWSDTLPAEIPWLFERMRREQTVQIAANNQADFAYFPVMAGDDFDQIVSLIVGCSRY
jgi:hypothetical protein